MGVHPTAIAVQMNKLSEMQSKAREEMKGSVKIPSYVDIQVTKCFSELDLNHDHLVSFKEFADGEDRLPSLFNVVRGLWSGCLEGTSHQLPALDGLNLTKTQAAMVVSLFTTYAGTDEDARLEFESFCKLFVEALAFSFFFARS
jgi:hypothetical protein